MIAALLEIYVRSAQTIGHYAVASQGQLTFVTLVAWAIAIFIVLASFIFFSIRNASAWIPSSMVAQCLRTLGLATYPFYLIHEVVGGLLLSKTVAYGVSYQTGVVIAVLAVVAVSCLIALYAEPWVRRACGEAILSVHTQLSLNTLSEA